MLRINPELLRLARQTVELQAKQAFVASGDPTMDPAAAAAAGGDPAAGGGDPAAAAGAAPAGGGGGDPLAALLPTIQQIVQQQMAQSGGMGGGAAGAGGPIKPKIDVNMEIMKIEKMLAKIMDAMQISMPVSDMVATSDDLTQMAVDQQNPTPSGAAGGAIPPVQPMDPMKAAAWEQGHAFTPPASMHYAHTSASQQLSAKAQAVLLQHRARNATN